MIAPFYSWIHELADSQLHIFIILFPQVRPKISTLSHFSIFMDLTLKLVEVKLYDPNFQNSEKSQHLVIFLSSRTRGLTELKLHAPNFHEFEKSQHLVIFPFADLRTRGLEEV
jgi:hypothetical protein